MTILGLILTVLILCVVIWAIQTLSSAFGLPEQIRAVILVLVVVVFVIWIVSAFAGAHLPVIPLR